jgi:hypothetical protein
VTLFLDALERGVTSRPGGKNFAMLHYRNTDSDGHSFGWGSPEYLQAILKADQVIGSVLSRIDQSSQLQGSIVIVTTDHGGIDYGHSTHTDPNVYRIPFFVWGAGIPAGVDLYELCGNTRQDPGDEAPLESPSMGPVRNGDAANLALTLLGLEEIEGSLHRGLFPAQGVACSPADAGAPPADSATDAGLDASVRAPDASLHGADSSVVSDASLGADSSVLGDAAGPPASTPPSPL